VPGDQAKNESAGMTPIEALHAACARNAPLEIVQADLVGEEPFARGRMIEIESGVLMVEEVQIIGKCAKFAKQTPVVCFFRFGNPAGYVVHEETKDFNTAFLVTVAPFLVNSLLCIVICFPAYLPMKVFELNHALTYFLLWLGLSIGMHAFPSTHDANALFAQAKKAASSGNPLAIVSFPLVVAIYAANILSIVWFDLIYGVAIGIGLPALVL